MSICKLVLGVVTLAGLTACGGGDGGGTPTTPSVSVVSLAISPATDLIKIKASETWSVNASFADGTSRAVEAVWGSDNTAVSTASAGRVTGVSPGEATVFADYQGQRATRRLRVVPDYHGRWSGNHQQAACIADGDWAGACDDLPNGEVYGLDLSLSQTRDTLTGTADIGDAPADVHGIIRPSGHLGLEGTYRDPEEELALEGTFVDWETLTTDNERMIGRFSVVFRTPLLRGSLRVDCELRTMSKTSSTALVVLGARSAQGSAQTLASRIRTVRNRRVK